LQEGEVLGDFPIEFAVAAAGVNRAVTFDRRVLPLDTA